MPVELYRNLYETKPRIFFLSFPMLLPAGVICEICDIAYQLYQFCDAIALIIGPKFQTPQPKKPHHSYRQSTSI